MSWLTIFHDELTNYSKTKPRTNPEARGGNLPDLVSFPRYQNVNSEFLRERTPTTPTSTTTHQYFD